MCQAGYWANPDGYCDVLSAPKCTAASIASNLNFKHLLEHSSTDAESQRYVRRYYTLSKSMIMVGCASCSSADYIPVTASRDVYPVCIPSSYVQYQKESLTPSDSALVRNCALYRVAYPNGRYACSVCAAGFALSSDGRKCVALPNCVVAGINDPNTCITCQQGFIAIKGTCVRPTIANCAAFIEGLVEEKCLECHPGFALSLDRKACMQGSVANCVLYRQGSSGTCLQCAKKHTLLNLKSTFYCFPFPDSLNCDVPDEAYGLGSTNGVISCAKCSASSTTSYGLSDFENENYLLDKASSTCLPVPKITGCVEYEANKPVFNDNTFLCLKCDAAYYISSDRARCITSTPVSNCATYSPTVDACVACNQNYFLTATNSCQGNPTGIFMCINYSNPGQCSECGSPYYLSSNSCRLSPVIENCERYSDYNTCSLCSQSYILQSPQLCQRAVAENCYTYFSPTACSSCDPSNVSMGLQTTNGVTNCVKISLSNCVAPSQVYPFGCLTCAAGYYPNTKGACIELASKIENCLYHDTSNTCTTCMPNYVLGPRKNTCAQTSITGTDPNCSNLVQYDAPKCSVCQFGFYLSADVCIACSNHSKANGCLTCNANDSSCLICLSDYTQDSKGACVKNASALAEEERIGAESQAEAVRKSAGTDEK